MNGYRYILLSLLYGVSLVLSAEDIATFRMTGVEGNVGLAYQSDEYLHGQIAETKLRDSLSTTQENVYILTHSYIYHPNLLSIDLGAGINFVQSELETTTGNAETDDELTRVTAKLRFLEKKPYPVTLYYDRDQPLISPSLTERFVQENERYGMNLALNQPLLPFSVNLEAFHVENHGSGVTRVIEDSSDQVLLRAYRSIGKDGYGQLTYHTNHRQSSSGLINLERTETDISSESISFDTHFNFGEKNQLRLSNLLSYYTQDNTPSQQDFRFAPILNWTHSDDASSYYRFDYLDSEIEQGQIENINLVVGGIRNLSKALSMSGDVHSNSVEIKQENETAFTSSTTGINASLNYNQPLSFGTLRLGMNFGYDTNSRNSGIVTVYREAVRLESTSVALQNNFVTNVQTVVNELNQVLVEGADYELIVIGEITHIRRIVSGNIAFGETVYVTYSYESDEDVTYSLFRQGYSASLDFLKYYSVYAQFSDNSVSIDEGSSSQLSSTQQTRTGFRIDVPFMDDEMRIGGEISNESREDDFSPYDRQSGEVFYQTKLFSDSRLRLNARTVDQDNHNSNEDIALERQSAQLVLHPWPRASITFEVSNEKDTGGTVLRRTQINSIIGRWRLRKLLIEVDARSIHEVQDETEREHNVLSARLNREF